MSRKLDEQRINNLEQKLHRLVVQVKNSMPEYRKPVFRQLVKHAEEYFELTGRHYDITKIGELQKLNRNYEVRR